MKTKNKENIFSTSYESKSRTYFFDLKKTKNGDIYLTITESKKIFNKITGKTEFEKHKIFIYEESFDRFIDALNEVVEFINDYKNN